jgi:hypothetical protein
MNQICRKRRFDRWKRMVRFLLSAPVPVAMNRFRSCFVVTRWLNPKEQDSAELQPMHQVYQSEKMVCWPINRHVNPVKLGSDKGLIDRIRA